jgi:aspartate 1-decarboxylase
MRRHVPGDLVIVMSFASYDEAGAPQFRPRVVLLDTQNLIVRPQLRAGS